VTRPPGRAKATTDPARAAMIMIQIDAKISSRTAVRSAMPNRSMNSGNTASGTSFASKRRYNRNWKRANTVAITRCDQIRIPSGASADSISNRQIRALQAQADRAVSRACQSARMTFSGCPRANRRRGRRFDRHARADRQGPCDLPQVAAKEPAWWRLDHRGGS